jgi:hypothetical protein
MSFGQCSYCGSIFHDSEDCDIRLIQKSQDAKVISLRAEVSRLTCELAAAQQERDALAKENAILSNANDNALLGVSEHHRDLRTVCDERDALAAALSVSNYYQLSQDELEAIDIAKRSGTVEWVDFRSPCFEGRELLSGLVAKGFLKAATGGHYTLIKRPTRDELSAILASVRAKEKNKWIKQAVEMAKARGGMLHYKEIEAMVDAEEAGNQNES